MSEVTAIGLDLAKNLFQVHAVDTEGKVVIAKKIRGAQLLTFFWSLEPSRVGMEVCGAAHHWARELQALGHEVKSMSPSYVKPYVKKCNPARHSPSHKWHPCLSAGLPEDTLSRLMDLAANEHKHETSTSTKPD